MTIRSHDYNRFQFAAYSSGIISRTKHAKDSIFVGSKQDTLDAFKQLILQRNQWTDYIEDVLRLVTINECDDTTTAQILTQASFPY